MQQRWYEGANDLDKLQQLVSERTARMGKVSSLHPGDVAHRIYNAFRFEDPSTLVPIWEDAAGVVGFALLWPLMTTPGYSPDRGIVAVADNGSFAGFAVTWYDHLNSWATSNRWACTPISVAGEWAACCCKKEWSG
jgi:hypothetical protein